MLLARRNHALGKTVPCSGRLFVGRRRCNSAGISAEWGRHAGAAPAEATTGSGERWGRNTAGGFTKADVGGYKLGQPIVGDPTKVPAPGVDPNGMNCNQLLGIVRDFKGSDVPGGHPDFEAYQVTTPPPVWSRRRWWGSKAGLCLDVRGGRR